MIILKNIKKVYKSKSGNIVALNDINLELPNKGLISILGQSGSGKTTLLNIIGLLDKQTSGEIFIYDRNLNEISKKEKTMFRKDKISIVFQDYHLLSDFNVEKNISLGLEIQGIKDNKRVKDVLNKVNLNEKSINYINQLSGGQKQRVSLARAIVRSSNIIIADEPTGNLDEKTEILMFDLLRNIANEKLVLIVTHNRNIANRFSDRIIEIKDGSIIYDINNNSPVKESIILENDIIYVPNNSKFDNYDWILIKKHLLEIGEVKLKLLNNINNEKFDITKQKDYYINPSGKMLFKDYFSIIINNILSKKFRLFLSSIISIISLLLISIIMFFSNFDINETLYKTYNKNNINYISFSKYEQTNMSKISVPEDDITFFHNKYNVNINKLIDMPLQLNIETAPINDQYFTSEIKGFSFVNDNDVNLLYGEFPNNVYEVLLTDYIANELVNYGSYNSIESIINQEIIFDNFIFIISGIIKTNASNYEALKNYNDNLYLLRNEFRVNLKDIYARIYISNNYISFINDYGIAKDVKFNQDSFIFSASVYSKYVNDSDVIISFPENYDGIYINYKLYNDLKFNSKSNDELLDISLFPITGEYKIYSKNIKIKGVINDYLEEDSYFIFSSQEKFEDILNNIYVTSSILINLKSSNYINSEFYHDILERGYRNESYITESIYDINDSISLLYMVFISILFIIILITIIFILNYLLTIINDRKKDIGILLCLGMSTKQITFIFIFNTLFLNFFQILLTLISLILSINYINKIFSKSIGYSLEIISINYSIISFIILIYLFISVILTFFLILKTIRKQPIELLEDKI